MTDFARIAQHIADSSGQPFQPATPTGIGGGCINTALKLSDGDRHWFIKLNDARRLDMFEAEFAGLATLADSQTIRVPKPLCTGIAGDNSYIVMEYIPLGHPAGDGQALAGQQLAALHRQAADRFGWHRDNTIGATHQPNDWRDDWIGFYCEQRLGFQLQLAAENGYGGRLQSLGEALLDACPGFIDHAPQPSLLHGDLWGGNLSYDKHGQPVIYDPATYYGDREADIAMTELFGDFSNAFYSAYNATWPLDAGYQTRKTLYNLYHVLNHLNLFGGGYRSQAEGMMARLLVEVV